MLYTGRNGRRNGSNPIWTAGRTLNLLLLLAAYCFGTASSRKSVDASLLLKEYHTWGIAFSSSQISVTEKRGCFSNTPLIIRGGHFAETDDDNSSEDEYEEESSEDEYEVEEEEEKGEGEEVNDEKQVASKNEVQEYDEPLIPSPFINLYASLGVMMLARKIDLFNPTVVKLARLAFIAYLIALQIFVLFVRIQAKRNNDRSPVEITSPFTSVLQSQLGGDDAGGAAGGMMKSLASSFLSSRSTVVEYDLKQANSMQSGLIFNMLFMWFLHFKMEQVQPLIIQSVTGLSNMLYSPLFQVYVLGRNLERPFKSQSMNVPKADEVNDLSEEEATKEIADDVKDDESTSGDEESEYDESEDE